ncbi:MAG: putative metalloprotease CJM1_0395 family protein, partial [Alphaproteobacteria bacterium]|nr:putative metalloprotease CJM1_0395 family protein [Alphaproteobacteria bacterium]
MISGVSPSIAAIYHATGAQHRPSEGDDAAASADPSKLTDEQRLEVERLKERDREVRAHEQAHARAGGPYASAPSYEFVRGPDGKSYAVSGEVQIDTAPID